MSNLFDPALVKTFAEDRDYLASTQIPIITVSGTYREDAKRMHGLPNNNTSRDIVLSRAHYSMAIAIAVQAWGGAKTAGMDPAKAWLADPTNFVSTKDWFSVSFTEKVGMTLARHPLLKLAKDFVDKFGRSKLPILNSITNPLLFLTEKVERPILSFHVAAGNILAAQGKKVVQVITDPHVRLEYLTHAENKNVHFCVFDDATRLEFLEKAAIQGIKADANRLTVTGPPVDPRIIEARKNKNPWRSGPLHLCITTGGLGTNKTEIESLLQQILPELRKKRGNEIRLLIYAGTHSDICQLVEEMAKQHRVPVGKLSEKTAKLRVIYHPQIIDANELLIKHAFPWADGFISKPSGDMAYDAVCSGSFLLTLQEWGEWEHNVRATLEHNEVARKADPKNILPQLEVLMSAKDKSQSWVEEAMHNALKLEKLFFNGAKNIVEAHQKFSGK
ncbi:MAG: hypothetical protein QG639_633 [Patescibacteria group bacterium]|nr:hypothetical protein [Patescibacteria group bacterium]